MKWSLLFLLFLVGCNSEVADLSSIQGIRNPNDPLPQIVDVSGPSANLYVLNDTIEFYVTFSEPVNVTGAPLLNFIADNGPLTADYISGSGTNLLTFRKTIANGEYETTGIVLNGNLSLNGGTILSFIDLEPADLSYRTKLLTGVRINAIITEFQSMDVPADGLYKLADDLCFTLKYNAPVSFSSGPATLPITVGAAKATPFVSGDGTKNLRFCYPVEAGIDVDGISVGASIDGGTLVDVFGDPVATAFTSPGALAGVLVDSIPPSISSLSSVPADGIFYTNEDMLFNVTFSEPVNVVGNPVLSLTVGSIIRTAQVVASNGTDTLTFKYAVESNASDTNGIELAPTILYPTGAHITDLAGNNIDQSESFVVPSLANVKVDGIPPVKLRHYFFAPTLSRSGDLINIFMDFSETIYMTGIPQIDLDIGGTIKKATLISALAGTTMHFQYEVEPNLKDTDGITILAGVTGGTLKDGPTANAHDITFASFTATSYKVDSFTYISSAAITSDSEYAGKSEGSYKPLKTVELQVTFSDTVTVTGTPRIDFVMDGTTKSLVYTGGTATPTLTFAYTVSATDIDLDGIDINPAISLVNSTIKDSTNTDVLLTLPTSFNPSIYLIPPDMDYWMDVSDPLSTVYIHPNFNTIFSKAEANIPFFDGTYPTKEDDGVFIGAHFGTDASTYYEYSNIPMTYLIVVYRAPPVYTPNNKAFTFGPYSFEFWNDGRIRTQCSLCKHYNGTTWVASTTDDINQYLGGYLWLSSEPRIVSLYIPFGTYNLRLADQFIDGEIAEVITLSAYPGNTNMNKIHQYLKNKHGVDF